MFRLLSFLARASVVGLALAFVLTRLYPEIGTDLRARLGVAAPPVAVATASATTVAEPQVSSYAQAVQRAAPAVDRKSVV